VVITEITVAMESFISFPVVNWINDFNIRKVISSQTFQHLQGYGLGLWCLTPISTMFQLYLGSLSALKVESSNPADGEVYSMQHYVIKFVSDLPQVGGFLWFPPSTKLTAKI
jgi:hypothetical protein